MVDKNKIRDKLNFREKLILFLGITSTMPIIGIPVGGRYITIFTICFVVVIGYILISNMLRGSFSFRISGIKKTYLLFLIWPIISYISGMLYMPSTWHSSMTSYLIRALQYLLLTVLLYITDYKSDAKAFSKGLVIGIVANAIWSIFEAVSYYFFRRSLNDMIFGRFLGISREVLLWNRYGGIRVCGFNYDPAHLGGILPILLFYGLMKRNIYLIILSALSLAFSQSTTALAGAIVVIIVYIVINKVSYKKGRNVKITSKTIISAVISISVIAGALLILGSNGTLSKFTASITENISGYITRINTVYVTSSNTVEPRRIYYTRFFDGLVERGPLLSFSGTGLGTSLYPFRNVDGLFGGLAKTAVAEIETNYVAYLFDLGIVGLYLYVALLIGGLKKLWKLSKHDKNNVNILYLGFIISIICCSFFYHYIFTAYQMLAFSFATIWICNINENEVEVKN